ncbi:MAG: VIT domain-containing protein [Marinicella sp.]
MKKWYVLSLLLCQLAIAQDDDYEERYAKNTRIDSPQPYFKILNKDSKVDQIPLLMTTVDAHINGVVAEVEVTQYYKNDGNRPLEAQYVFPGSTGAAVYHLDMQVGDRLIDAQVQAKDEAQKTYEQAKSEGKTASLLEQGDPGLFTMNVANILPGDDIRVTLKYTEKIIPSEGSYRFRYPAIGRPSVLAKGSTAPQTYAPGADMGFDLSVRIDAPLPINAIESKNHMVDTEWESEQSVLLLLDIDETLNFKDDFIIDYDLRGAQVNSGMAIYEEGEDGYFLMMVEPPAKFKNSEVVNREYIFVVDSSGSMDGEPMDNAKFIASSLLTELKPEEYFNVVLFAGDSALLSDQPLSATEQNINAGLEMVDVSHAGGGTNLITALEQINRIPTMEGVSRSLIVLTDGAISVADATIKLLRETPDQNVFVIGVSAGYGNDNAAIDAIAKAGQGLSFYAIDDTDINKLQSQFLDYVRYPLLTDISVDAIGFESIELFPKNINDLFAQKPLYVTGKYAAAKRGSIEVKGVGNGNQYQQFFDLDGLNHADENIAIKYLWAKEKIDDLMFDKRENKDEITALGLAHNLLTHYTSFVAVDHVVRSDGNVEKVAKTPKGNNMFGYGYAEDSLAISTQFKPKTLTNQLEINQLSTLLAFEQAKPKDRRSITFIMGEDNSQTNQFYQTATSIYGPGGRLETDVIVDHLRNIAEVKAYLATQNNPVQPWGLINIISHSSPWSGLSNRNEDGNHLSMNLFSLESEIQRKDFQPLSHLIVDQHTEIRLIGCALGSQKHMLRRLSMYLGGYDVQRPVVKAPFKYVYLTKEDPLNQTHVYSFDVPWKISQDVNMNREQLESQGLKSQEVEISFIIPGPVIFNQRNLDKLIEKQSMLDEFLTDMNVTKNDFSWELVTEQSQTRLVGKSYLISKDIKFVEPELLTPINFNDKKMVSIAH